MLALRYQVLWEEPAVAGYAVTVWVTLGTPVDAKHAKRFLRTSFRFSEFLNPV